MEGVTDGVGVRHIRKPTPTPPRRPISTKHQNSEKTELFYLKKPLYKKPNHQKMTNFFIYYKGRITQLFKDRLANSGLQKTSVFKLINTLKHWFDSYCFFNSPFTGNQLTFWTVFGFVLLITLRLTSDLESFILYPFLVIYIVPIVLSIVKRRLSTFVVMPLLFTAFLFLNGELRQPKQVSPTYQQSYWLHYNSNAEYIGVSKEYVLEKEGKSPPFVETYSNEIEIWFYPNKTIKFEKGQVVAYTDGVAETSYIRRFENP